VGNNSLTNPLVVSQEIVREAPGTSRVLDKEFVGVFAAGDATPSVLNLKKFKAGNTSLHDLTYFDDGFDGQDISIRGDDFTNVIYDLSKVITNTGANKVLASTKVYRFTRFDSVWIEDA
jgi:hypothetical protein